MRSTVAAPPSVDRQLVDVVLAGDREAFRVLVERESRSVIGACRRVLGDADEAEDVAQEAFLRAFTALATYRGDGSFGAWVSRIAVRLAVARLAAHPQVAWLDPETADGWASPLRSDDDPQARALDLEWRQAIQQAIAALPQSQRSVVALRFYGDLTLEEIAEATSTPLGTVKSRLHRGLAGLRDQLPSRSAQ
jgi:RNA polymerase sigma-70 factor, ECF subfamily